jgi:hypothetical protein
MDSQYPTNKGPSTAVAEPARIAATRSSSRQRTEMFGVRCTPAAAEQFRAAAAKNYTTVPKLMVSVLNLALTLEKTNA